MSYIGPAPANSIIATSDIEDGAVTSAKLGGNIVTPGTLDVNGQELILDANANTSLTADTDDQVDIKVGGTDVVTLTNSSFVLKGTTPTLTIGDAGTEDTKIVFDGHAQDYYIGLDDTDDDLKLGLGSAVGTTAHIVIDETGAVTKPLQPCVLAKVASKQNNVGGSDQQTDIPFATEIFDQNSDYSSPSFTAPVTGRYLMIAEVTCGQLDTDATFYQLYAVASNRTHYFSALATDRLISSDGSMSMGCAQIIDMDASDTLKIQLAQSDGATQTDIEAESYFSICLLA